MTRSSFASAIKSLTLTTGTFDAHRLQSTSCQVDLNSYAISVSGIMLGTTRPMLGSYRIDKVNRIIFVVNIGHRSDVYRRR